MKEIRINHILIQGRTYYQVTDGYVTSYQDASNHYWALKDERYEDIPDEYKWTELKEENTDKEPDFNNLVW